LQLTSKFKIKEFGNIVKFLNENNVGRLSTIDIDGFPQVIPMNFVYSIDFSNNNKRDMICDKFNSRYNVDPNREGITSNNNISSSINIDNAAAHNREYAVYMHSHHMGEKIDNLKRNSKVGFEVDREICFLPSYYFHPTDASFADTLYISVVIKGNASLVLDNLEKAHAMNSMMQKYQREGKYAELTKDSRSIQNLTVIKVEPKSIQGKYKIGQEWPIRYKTNIAKKIIEREGPTKAREILESMKIRILPDGDLKVFDQVTM
jgi:nitroimidazol reductase NimA-like FMN-containing flavoprotein (pyridoxamine 5'-phosphate oxidase superfamily)